MVVQGIETINLSMEPQCENSLLIAEYRMDYDKISCVRYPCLSYDSQYALSQKYPKGKGGPMVVFELKVDDTQKTNQLFLIFLIFFHLANVGDGKSLDIQPTSTTHPPITELQQIAAGVCHGMILLSAAMDIIDDIICGLEQAHTKMN
jgi:O-acetylhomoserine/O-acetylserine sulfhydrylase-like pyridoxal-dependent enzyme